MGLKTGAHTWYDVIVDYGIEGEVPQVENYHLLDDAIRMADYHLAAWSKSVSTVLPEPEVRVEDPGFVTVYEAWTERRRAQRLPRWEGDTQCPIYVETPTQFWASSNKAWASGETNEAPMPFGHLMFSKPDTYKVRLLDPIVNPAMLPS